jgi:glutamine synthetase
MAKLQPELYSFFRDLPQNGRITAEYIWVGGNGPLDIRSKVKCLDSVPKSVSDLPEWNYDGSSTNQAPGEDSEVLLIPRAIFPDPFRGGDNILVVADTYRPDDRTPLPTNTRHPAAKIFEAVAEHEPWYGIEQEYTLFHQGKPLGWPSSSSRSFGGPTVQVGYPGPQGPYYCAIGADVSFGREVVEAHLRACMAAGITISGTNAEVMPGQWEYQVGPVTGIASGDQMLVSRYILLRIGEMFDVVVSFDPKPIPGNWNGAGCHTNTSTKATRAPGGFDVILDHMKKLSARHLQHIAAYGEGNERRLTGHHETSSMGKFSFGVANRGCSIRIPRSTEAEKRGYYEDRRPASNMDPYVVTSLLAQTALL